MVSFDHSWEPWATRFEIGSAVLRASHLACEIDHILGWVLILTVYHHMPF